MIATVMVGVLHGLHAAHEAKDEHGEPLHIVHRDVSPQNILVGVDGVPRVLDFGVAKAAGRLHTTRDGQVKGKLSYMAPEQVLSQKLDRRTDVYGASAVLWEALTGRRLFTGENDGATLRNVLEGVVEPPSAHAPGISPELDALTLRGLSRDPETRFASARDMARALEAAATAVVASVIGDWVEATAREELEGRSKLVELVESDPEGKWIWAPTNEAVGASDATASLAGSKVEGETSAHTETSVVTSSEPRTSPTRVRSRMMIGAASLAAASLAGVAAFVAVGFSANRASQSNVAASLAASSAASATAPPAVAAASSPPSAAPPYEPDPPASSSAARMQRAPTPPRPTSTRPPTPTKAPPKRYVFDHL
jgi:eukaryotic-like serine/threonine-protein kinase